MTSHPPLSPVHAVVQALQSSGLRPTLGGSGLLHAYGLINAVRDWDVLVDTDVAAVQTALDEAGLLWTDAADRSGRYATSARLLLTMGDAEIDLMVEFAIWPEGASHDGPPVRIPSIPSGTWNGIPLGSLEAWLAAYRLMRRPNKPDRIHEYLATSGVNHDHLERMLAEPLPEHMRRELMDLRLRGNESPAR